MIEDKATMDEVVLYIATLLNESMEIMTTTILIWTIVLTVMTGVLAHVFSSVVENYCLDGKVLTHPNSTFLLVFLTGITSMLMGTLIWNDSFVVCLFFYSWTAQRVGKLYEEVSFMRDKLTSTNMNWWWKLSLPTFLILPILLVFLVFPETYWGEVILSLLLIVCATLMFCMDGFFDLFVSASKSSHEMGIDDGFIYPD